MNHIPAHFPYYLVSLWLQIYSHVLIFTSKHRLNFRACVKDSLTFEAFVGIGECCCLANHKIIHHFLLSLPLWLYIFFSLSVFNPNWSKAGGPEESGPALGFFLQGSFSWPLWHRVCSWGSVDSFSECTMQSEMPLVVILCCMN